MMAPCMSSPAKPLPTRERLSEVRYEIRDSVIYVLRLWHTREDRN